MTSNKNIRFLPFRNWFMRELSLLIHVYASEGRVVSDTYVHACVKGRNVVVQSDDRVSPFRRSPFTKMLPRPYYHIFFLN